MRILCIINHPTGLPYLVGEEIAEAGGECVHVNPHEGQTLPQDSDDFAGLLVLGGAMSAGDRDNDHVFEPMTALIRTFHAEEKPVLGICLGSQLLARSFAARVYPHADLEVGYVPLTVTDAGARDPLLCGVGREQVIFEWHYETFDLPDQAELLMTGRDCRHQAFRVGATSYGFQCHFEVDAERVRYWLEAGRETLDKHRGRHATATDREIRARIPRYAARAESFARGVSRNWMAMVSAQTGQGRLRPGRARSPH